MIAIGLLTNIHSYSMQLRGRLDPIQDLSDMDEFYGGFIDNSKQFVYQRSFNGSRFVAALKITEQQLAVQSHDDKQKEIPAIADDKK